MYLVPNGKLLPGKFFTKTILVINLTTALLMNGCLQVAAGRRISPSRKDLGTGAVTKEITRQGGYYFRFESDFAGLEPNVDVKGLECRKPSPDILLATIDVHGKVVDENGEPLAGATVSVKGTKEVVAANEKGEFILKGVDPNASLVITNVGFDPITLKVEGRGAVNIVLRRKVSQLDETQVIAYGTTTQRFSVGSISKVTAEDIESQPVTNPLQALEGRVPGLVVTQTGGVPGAALTVQVRGQNTLASSFSNGILPMDNPLFIIDGVPIATQNNSMNQLSSIAAPGAGGQYQASYSGMSPLNSLNPADIESIEVLRDADATAIYGSRGANGVVLITTKRGKGGKTRFTANVWTGQSEVTRMPQMMNTQEYLAMRREAYANDGLTPSGNPNDPNFAPDLFVFDTTKYTNWPKYFLGGSAHVVNANGTLEGGDANTQFLVGGGFHHETYITPGNFADIRASVNMGLHHRSPNQRLKIDFSAYYGYDQNNSVTPELLLGFIMPPNYPTLENPDGTLNWSYNGFDLYNADRNPLAYIRQVYNAKTANLVSSLQVEYRLFPNFTLRSHFGFNTTHFVESDAFPLSSQDALDYAVSSADFGANDYQTWVIEPQAEYRKNINRGNLDVLLGGTFQENTNSTGMVSGSNYASDALLESIAGAGTITASANNNQYNYSGGFARLNYILNKRYIIDLNARRDGSSNFGPGRQFGTFASEGLGWIFSEEKSIKRTIPWLSYGKLHESYGTTGSDAVTPYQFLPGWTPSYYRYNGNGGFAPQNLYNPDFSWAVTKKFEFGIDLGLFKDRLILGATWFQNRCGNQLVEYSLPEQTGFYGVTENLPAVVQNRGWEFRVSGTIVKARKFRWEANLNLTIPENRLVSFPGIANSPYAYTYIVGQSLSVLNMFKTLGVNDTTGFYEFLTNKGTPTYNPDFLADKRIIGNLDPKYYGGLMNSFSYKGWRLGVFLEFKRQLGRNYLNSMYANVVPGWATNLPTTFLSRWRKPGDQSPIQQVSTSFGQAYSSGNNYHFSDGAFSNASYMRVKTVSLSYNFPSEFIRKRLKMESGNVYLNAQNLFTITKFQVIDPESQQMFGVPPLRTVTAGIQLMF